MADHTWSEDRAKALGIPGAVCSACLVVRRKDGKNKPCEGPSRPGLRDSDHSVDVLSLAESFWPIIRDMADLPEHTRKNVAVMAFYEAIETALSQHEPAAPLTINPQELADEDDYRAVERDLPDAESLKELAERYVDDCLNERTWPGRTRLVTMVMDAIREWHIADLPDPETMARIGNEVATKTEPPSMAILDQQAANDDWDRRFGQGFIDGIESWRREQAEKGGEDKTRLRKKGGS